MTDDTQQNGHLSTEWLAHLHAQHLLSNPCLDVMSDADPRVVAAEANGDVIRVTYSYRALWDDPDKRTEVREFRLSPVLLLDEEQDAPPDDAEPEKAVA